MSTTETELAEEIEQISELGHLVGWWTAAEAIEQAHERFERALVDDGEPLSVFQLARLRRLDLIGRWLMIQPAARGPLHDMPSIQAQFLQTATREQLASAILEARS